MNTPAEVHIPSKVKRAHGELLRLIGERGPGIKLPTIGEMCADFAVSRGTLEEAMRPLEDKGLLRRRRGSGIYVTDRIRQKTIGVVFGGDIFDRVHSPYWSLLLKAVREQTGGRADLHAQAYMDISQGHDGLGGLGQLIEDLDAKRLDGLLLIYLSQVVSEQLGAYGVPQVISGDGGVGWRAGYDQAAGLRLFAKALAARKCRRVVLMPSLADYCGRLAEAMRKAGVTDAQVLGPYGDMTPAFDASHEEVGCAVMRLVLAARSRGEPLPDAVVSVEDDGLALGAIRALLEAGLKPGRDIQIASLVNKGSPMLKPYADDLIQVEIDPAEQVRACLAMLETLMSGGTPKRNPLLLTPVLLGWGGGSGDRHQTSDIRRQTEQRVKR